MEKAGDCMKVRILGFDPGTANTGYGCIEGNSSEVKMTKHYGLLNTKKEDGEVRERIDTLGVMVRELVEIIKPTHIAIEDFTEQGKLVGKTYKEMAWLTEHLRMTTRELGYEVAIYENGEWKKQTMGVMRANKVQVQHFISHKIPGAKEALRKQKDHVWDSVGIAYCKYTNLIKQGVK